MGCYIWYSEEGPGRAAAPPNPLLAVPNVTAHPSTASVPITVLLLVRSSAVLMWRLMGYTVGAPAGRSVAWQHGPRVSPVKTRDRLLLQQRQRAAAAAQVSAIVRHRCESSASSSLHARLPLPRPTDVPPVSDPDISPRTCTTDISPDNSPSLFYMV